MALGSRVIDVLLDYFPGGCLAGYVTAPRIESPTGPKTVNRTARSYSVDRAPRGEIRGYLVSIVVDMPTIGLTERLKTPPSHPGEVRFLPSLA